MVSIELLTIYKLSDLCADFSLRTLREMQLTQITQRPQSIFAKLAKELE